MDIKILKKSDVLKIIKDEDFISAWKTLAKESDEFTLIQEFDFVASWYRAYQNQYSLVMVIAYDQGANIVGILPLAISLKNGEISHAGDGQAEYNSWICSKKNEEEFLVQSLIALKKEFKLLKWDWGWMPPNASIDWLKSKELEQHGIYVNVGTFDSPRYDLNDLARITKIKKSKSIRSNTNRLKRSGDLNIERITDVDRAKEIFVDLKKIYNFRNLAVYNNMPFEEDECKEQWHLDHLQNANDSVHFSVLWQGDDLLASNFGFCSDTTVMMGLFAYNPVQGARSPGNIFLIMLTEYIAKEGFQYLDLTPGGDPYKERFCNNHITLTKPIFFFSHWTKYKNNALIYIKNKIKEKYSYRDIMKLKTSLEQKLKGIVLNQYKNSGDDKSKLFLYAPNKDKFHNLELGFQKFDDLLIYKNDQNHKKITEVVFDALKNFERDDHLYTLVQDGELIAYAWVSTSKRKHAVDKINELITIVGTNALIYDFYFVKNSDNKLMFDFLQTVSNNYVEESDVFLVKPLLVDDKEMLERGYKKNT